LRNAHDCAIFIQASEALESRSGNKRHIAARA
jgi:hypothetical protein